MKTIRKLKAVRLMVAALVATGLFAVAANAQHTSIGTFTLPNEVRWGDMVVAAGEYALRVDDNNNGTTLIQLQEAKSRKRMAFVLFAIPERNAKGQSVLLISNRGGQRIVHSLRLRELGVTFVYNPALARGRETVQEARETQEVPVLAAKK